MALALGDGLTVPDVASTVAVGCEWPIDRSVLVTVHSHPSLVVHWTKKVDGDGTVATYAHTTTLAGETETYDAASNPRSTIGLRVPGHTHTVGITTNDFAQGTWFARHTAAEPRVRDVDLRLRSGGSADERRARDGGGDAVDADGRRGEPDLEPGRERDGGRPVQTKPTPSERRPHAEIRPTGGVVACPREG